MIVCAKVKNGSVGVIVDLDGKTPSPYGTFRTNNHADLKAGAPTNVTPVVANDGISMERIWWGLPFGAASYRPFPFGSALKYCSMAAAMFSSACLRPLFSTIPRSHSWESDAKL